jgi:hypothetical protein
MEDQRKPLPTEKTTLKKILIVTSIIVIAIILITGILVILINASPTADNSKPAGTQIEVIQPAASTHLVKKVEHITGAQVAAKMGCTHYKDHGSAAAGMVKDSGSCIMGGYKYALDTFANRGVRNHWLTLAKPYGVKPVWTSATAVFYPSVP